MMETHSSKLLRNVVYSRKRMVASTSCLHVIFDGQELLYSRRSLPSMLYPFSCGIYYVLQLSAKKSPKTAALTPLPVDIRPM